MAALNHPSHLLVADLKISKRLGMCSIAAFLQLELFRLY
ncbi:hypothetical protein yinte0001_37430 [Yersinia intermedia ATCC 29909]|nr:hypothetical protein yinte0001_37430 [Yersinia intermedia ATCC 29909]